MFRILQVRTVNLYQLTKKASKGVLATEKLFEHLLWAAECEGESREVGRKV